MLTLFGFLNIYMKTTISLHKSSQKIKKPLSLTYPSKGYEKGLIIFFLYKMREMSLFYLFEYHKQLETASAGVLPLWLCTESVTHDSLNIQEPLLSDQSLRGFYKAVFYLFLAFMKLPTVLPSHLVRLFRVSPL